MHDDSKNTTLPIAREIVDTYVTDDVKLPWYIDLLNINLDNHDLATAKARIALYVQMFRKGRHADHQESGYCVSETPSRALTQSGQREPESENGPCSRPVLNSLGPTHRAAGAIGQDERRCDRRPANVIARGGTSGSSSHATRQRTSGSPSDVACARASATKTQCFRPAS